MGSSQKQLDDMIRIEGDDAMLSDEEDEVLKDAEHDT